ncbi:MAG: DUF2742 domain-containing protein [Mycobacterium sp.]
MTASVVSPVTARTVDWWAVHQFVAGWLDHLDRWPMAGTLEWQRLADDDPFKWASLLDAAQHWALRVDTAQAATTQASHAIAAAVDWRRLASEIQQRSTSTVYIPRLTQ